MFINMTFQRLYTTHCNLCKNSLHDYRDDYTNVIIFVPGFYESQWDMQLYMTAIWMLDFSISVVYETSTNIHELHKVRLDIALVGWGDVKATIVSKVHFYFVVILCIIGVPNHIRPPISLSPHDYSSTHRIHIPPWQISITSPHT